MPISNYEHMEITMLFVLSLNLRNEALFNENL